MIIFPAEIYSFTLYNSGHPPLTVAIIQYNYILCMHFFFCLKMCLLVGLNRVCVRSAVECAEQTGQTQAQWVLFYSQ